MDNAPREVGQFKTKGSYCHIDTIAKALEILGRNLPKEDIERVSKNKPSNSEHTTTIGRFFEGIKR